MSGPPVRNLIRSQFVLPVYMCVYSGRDVLFFYADIPLVDKRKRDAVAGFSDRFSLEFRRFSGKKLFLPDRPANGIIAYVILLTRAD